MTRQACLTAIGALLVVWGCGDSTGSGGSGASSNGGGGSTNQGAGPVGGNGGEGGTPVVGGGGSGQGGAGGTAQGGAGGGTGGAGPVDTCFYYDDCDPSVASECLCYGCGDGTTCDNTVDCACSQCTGNTEFCPTTSCTNDGLCDPYLESCDCEDCADELPCQ